MSRTLASNIVTRALEKSLKQDSINSPFTVSENNIAIDELNDMMFEWASAYDLNVGYSEVNKLTDETNLPYFSLSAVKNNLAFRLSAEFGRELNQGLILQARQGLDALVARLVVTPDITYPNTLPTGSGSCYNYRNYFKDDNIDDLETENNNNINTDRNFPIEVDTIPIDPGKKI